ncbi:MAG: hypothetical protein R2849_23800, partial [Thermomicrobiales bacterium]
MPATGGTGGGNTTEPRAYPIYRAAGSHRQLGRLHGEQAGEQIQAHLALLYETLGLSRDSFQKRALRFLPLFERHCLHLVEEIKGL